MKSDKWDSIKKRLFKSRGKYCQVCKTESNLHIHHKNYDNWQKEKLSDLLILCQKCHYDLHFIKNKGNYPLKFHEKEEFFQLKKSIEERLKVDTTEIFSWNLLRNIFEHPKSWEKRNEAIRAKREKQRTDFAKILKWAEECEECALTNADIENIKCFIEEIDQFSGKHL